MKALGKSVFTANAGEPANPRAAYEKVSASDSRLQLPETWFRDAIYDDPALVIGPCQQAGIVPADEIWFPWGHRKKEFRCSAGRIDVLLLSSKGRPAIVETKLAYNAEGRREVVAQILEYAFSLQRTQYSEFPKLPEHDSAPDPMDVQDCMRAGKFLLVIAGDTLDARVVRLSDDIRANNLTSEWDLALVDLNLYRSTEADGGLLVVPELRGFVQSEVRQVVRVEGGSTGPRIVFERIAADDLPTTRREKLGSTGDFLKRAGQLPPHVREQLSTILERFQQLAEAPSGRFIFRCETASANLYWALGGKFRRILEVNVQGRFRIWLDYLLKAGAEDAAEAIRNLAKPLVSIPSDEVSAAVLVRQDNLSAILSVIADVASTLDRFANVPQRT